MKKHSEDKSVSGSHDVRLRYSLSNPLKVSLMLHTFAVKASVRLRCRAVCRMPSNSVTSLCRGMVAQACDKPNVLDLQPYGPQPTASTPYYYCYYYTIFTITITITIIIT